MCEGEEGMEFLTEVFVREDSLVPVKRLLGRVHQEGSQAAFADV